MVLFLLRAMCVLAKPGALGLPRHNFPDGRWEKLFRRTRRLAIPSPFHSPRKPLTSQCPLHSTLRVIRTACKDDWPSPKTTVPRAGNVLGKSTTKNVRYLSRGLGTLSLLFFFFVTCHHMPQRVDPPPAQSSFLDREKSNLLG